MDTVDPVRPGALERLRARFSSVDADLAALLLDGVTDDAAAIALLEHAPDDESDLWAAYDRRDVPRLQWWASGARWRAVVPLDEMRQRYGGLLDVHKAHLLGDLMAAHLLRQLDVQPGA